MNEHAEPQRVQVKVYESSDRLTVAAPMPGMEPRDITIEITPGNQLVLHGNGRGALKNQKLVLQDEWNPGPYCRELTLPSPVDGSMANVTYRNGILVVVLPLAEETRPAHLGLAIVGPDHGERIGNAGHPVQRLSSDAARSGGASAPQLKPSMKRLERSHCSGFVRTVGASDDVFSHSSALQGRARRAPQQRQCSCGCLGACHNPPVSRTFNAACVSHRWSAGLWENRPLAQCGTPTHKMTPVELAETSAHDRERTLLREITGLADHVRDMRLAAAALNDAQITLLTGDLQAKWDEVRALRAPPVSGEPPLRGHGGLYA